ncbi:ABC transporter permease [Niallia sp. XMNu-256]|uniref:ABC transporter permease n=1 Tax=Niallia sp. XMNu-256 TaxID=3082444 RepID=UPI0030CF35F6
MKQLKTYLSTGVFLFLMLLIWEVGARLYNKSFVLPSPIDIVVKLWELKDILILVHLPATLSIIFLGLAASILIGMGLAVWMYSSKTVEKTFYPLIIASQTIPTIALAPIFVVWFGYSIWSKVLVTFLIAFFPLTVSTFDGFKSANKNMRELLLTMGASKREIFLKLDVPSALPSIFSGLKVAVTASVIGAAIGEWLGAQAGLGYFSRRMMTQFDGAAVFAPIVILALVGMILFLLVIWLEKICLKWRN